MAPIPLSVLVIIFPFFKCSAIALSRLIWGQEVLIGDPLDIRFLHLSEQVLSAKLAPLEVFWQHQADQAH